MVDRYRLKEGVVIEFESDGVCKLIVPSEHNRLRVGPGVIQILCEVARATAACGGITLAELGDDDDLAALVDQLTSLGVLATAHSSALPRHRDQLTLIERATLRMAQMGGLFEPRLPAGREAPPRFQIRADASSSVPLPDPVVQPDVILWDTIIRRRSRRNGPERHLDLVTLSALFQHSLRIQTTLDDNFGEISLRPTASGGARHPVDALVSALRVSELPEGTYQYDSEQHRLYSLCISRAAAESLMSVAVEAMINRPDVLPALALFFAATTARTACKYENSSLVTIMKDVGCLIQQIYLIVEGLGLVGCAIGGGDGQRVEGLLGLDGTEVTYVGGFVVW